MKNLKQTNLELLSRRAFLQKAGLTSASAGLAGVSLGVIAEPLRADVSSSEKDLVAVPVVALSPPSPLMAQYVSATGHDSTFTCHIDDFIWDWGDGTPQNHGSFTHHYYQKPGTYEVKLTIVEGESSASATTVIEVPKSPPPPSTLQLLNNLQRQLLRIPQRFRQEMLRLLNQAREQVRQADRLASGSQAEQFEAAGRYVAAGEQVSAINELVTGLSQAGRIAFDKFERLGLEGFVPVFVSLSSNVNALDPAVLAALAPVGGCGWFWRRSCDLAFAGIFIAISLAFAGGVIGCGTLFTIPLIGPVLGVLCGLGIVITLAFAVAAALAWLDGWYEATSTT